MNKPRLIITADDYGMSPLFNQGIEELTTIGLITGISIMVKRPFVDPARLAFLQVSLGLHLELEELSGAQEIENQIISFRDKFGMLPTYIDGHQHKHLTPHNLALVIEAARRFHLPVRSRFEEDRAQLVSQNILTQHNFISWHPSRISILVERLQTAQVFPISELVVHPGYFDPACDYPYNQEREAELAFLKSPSFQELITPFELTSYSAIA